MLKVKKMVDQETAENVLDSNPNFSPIFCGYLLNNWKGIAPLWTSFHLGDQSKHGHTKPYLDWRELNVQKAFVINLPKNKGILEFHHKSTKHIVLSSSKERIDNLVTCLVEWKEAKRRAYNVQFTISKEGLKQTHVEDNNGSFKLPKLVKESWRHRKRKMHKGPGFYQQDKAKEKLSCDDKEDEDNGLQKIDNKNITF